MNGPLLRLQNGIFTVQAASSAGWVFCMSPTEQRVISVIHAVFDNKKQTPPLINPATVLDRSLGLESIDFAELVVRLEVEFGTDPFSNGTAGPISTVADLAALFAHQT